MARQVIPEIQTFERPTPPPVDVPQLDEGVWQAWIEKNKRLDKMRFTRRVEVIAILVLILGVVALVRLVA